MPQKGGDDDMSQYNLRLFALFRERVGCDVVAMDGPESWTVRLCLDHFFDCYPDLAGFREFSRLAVNCEFATPQRTISGSDELALIPPVSGG